jgi:aspartate/methionine/tyrosine aminotransferase
LKYPLLQRHRETDKASRVSGVVFPSGWQTYNPFAGEYLSAAEVLENLTDLASYKFLSDDSLLTSSIQAFHRRMDDREYEASEIFSGPGASSTIAAFMIMLANRGIKSIYYIAPLYYTFYYLADLLNIKLIPAQSDLLTEETVSLKLPKKRTWLLMSDPIWMTGVSLKQRHLERILAWQRETGSHVFIDGTFQYLGWGKTEKREHSSMLEKSLTFRLVCPTKTLALHGVRFAYLLLPSESREDIRYAASNISGASGSINVMASHIVMKKLNSDQGNTKLLTYIKRRYEYFRGRLFDNEIGQPTSSYYVFARPKISTEKCLLMDQDFFDITAYPEHVRFNLLMPEASVEELGLKF